MTYVGGWKALNLRMDPALRAKIESAAAENHRSLNAEIVHRLQQSLTGWR